MLSGSLSFQSVNPHHHWIFPCRYVLTDEAGMQANHESRRPRMIVTQWHQDAPVHQVCTPGHVPLHPSLCCHCPEEGEQKMASLMGRQFLSSPTLKIHWSSPVRLYLSVSGAVSLNINACFRKTARLLPSNIAVDRILLRVRWSPARINASRSGILLSLKREDCPWNWKWTCPSIPHTDPKRLFNGLVE